MKTFPLLILAALVSIFPSARAAPGVPDTLDTAVTGAGTVSVTAVQPDGRVIIAGAFTSVLGVPRVNIARLNADGTLDMGFDPRPNDHVWSLAVQEDGRVLLGGEFTSFQPAGVSSPVVRHYVARLNADGSLDSGFDPRANDYVYSVAVQSDAKVLLAGYFFTLQPGGVGAPVERWSIARLHADGSLDTSFDPRPDDVVYSMTMQTDGKVLLGGHFRKFYPRGAVDPIERWRIARLNTDGSLDAGFDPKADNYVYSIAEQADGKVLLGGHFLTLQPNGAPAPTARSRIARVHADGTLDTSFDPNADFWINSMAVQADGRVVIGGEFTKLQPNGALVPIPRSRIARLHADGTVDPDFDPQAFGAVGSVALQEDGRVLVGGLFTRFNPNGSADPIARRRFARLENGAPTQNLTVPDKTRVLWQRSGTAPDLSRVTFELSTDSGGNWTLLGFGTRMGITADWQLTGLSLPVSGQFRARGVTLGSRHNSSSGIIEQTAAFSLPHATDADTDGLLDTWELTYWPTTVEHSAADDADRDGYNELLELALGLNPTVSDSSGLPPVVNEGGYLTITITRQPGVTYEVQSAGTVLPALSDSFSAASTTVLINDAKTLKVRDNFLIGTPSSRFLRVKVKAAP